MRLNHESYEVDWISNVDWLPRTVIMSTPGLAASHGLAAPHFDGRNIGIVGIAMCWFLALASKPCCPSPITVLCVRFGWLRKSFANCCLVLRFFDATFSSWSARPRFAIQS